MKKTIEVNCMNTEKAQNETTIIIPPSPVSFQRHKFDILDLKMKIHIELQVLILTVFNLWSVS